MTVGALVLGARVLGGLVAPGVVSTPSFLVTIAVGLVRLGVVDFGHLGSLLPG